MTIAVVIPKTGNSIIVKAFDDLGIRLILLFL